MLNKILRLFILLLGIAIGPGLLLLFFNLYTLFSRIDLRTYFEPGIIFLFFLAAGIISGIIFLLLSGKLANAFEKKIKSIAEVVSGLSVANVFSATIGLILGLVIAALLSVVIAQIPLPALSVPLTIFFYILFGAVGLTMGMRRKFDVSVFGKRTTQKSSSANVGVMPKILDTSVIIDGRIFDICKTGMFEGELVVPEFVLEELQRIADSADAMKRARGRRGLDILNEMQKELKNTVRITDIDYEDTQEVDIKLLKLAKELNGKVVTNDYNLNKVAAVQDVEVFNINDLANAVKPILMAGEELTVRIVKDGKEQNQGVAYLEDGTMIVVEGARGKADTAMQVVVTSVLQTSAGRMVFAKIKTERL